MGQNRLTLLFKYQIGLNIEFERDYAELQDKPKKEYCPF